MTTSLVAIIAVVAAAVSAAVGLVSLRIVRRQEQMLATLQESAGVRSVEAVESAVGNTFVEILHKTAPRQRLRIVSVSGAALGGSGAPEIQSLVARGVSVDVLLLDPSSENLVFADRPALAVQVADTTRRLTALGVRVHYYNFPILESLVFIDDADLWLAPAPPFATSRALMYHIVNGPKSLYQLYESGFQYLWVTSRPAALGAS